MENMDTLGKACHLGAKRRRNWLRRIVGQVPVFFVLPLLAVAAQESSHRTFSVHVETQLVQVHVRVVGRDGKPVRGLKKTDFAVRVNGHRQAVATLDYVPVRSIVEKTVTQSAPARVSQAP